MLENGKSGRRYRRRRHMLKAVAAFEFFKGIGVVIMGVLALTLLHKDTWLVAESLLALLHISTDNRWAQGFLISADTIPAARLWAAARFAFAYAVLRFAEAYGL